MADIVSVNPGLKKPIMAILALMEGEGCLDRAGLEAQAREMWEPSYRTTPSTAIDILVRNGALAEQVLVDSEPYEGTLEDVQMDEKVADEAVACERVLLTDKGRALLERYAPSSTLSALFESRPQYSDVFQAMLWACDNEGGCSRDDLEAQINALPQLGRDPETGRTTVYPQYFIDALETAGGIEWDGAWHVTPAGRAATAA